MRLPSVFAATLVVNIYFIAANARTARQPPAEDPILGQVTSQGCFSTQGELASTDVQFATIGRCAQICRESDADNTVMAAQDHSCYCGKTYPPMSTLVDDGECDQPCPGYAVVACGGKGRYSVYNLGVDVDVEYSGGDDLSSNDGSDDAVDDEPSEDSATTTTTSEPTLTTTDAKEDTASPTTSDGTITTSAPTLFSSATQSPTSTLTSDPDGGSAGFDYGAILGSTVAGIALAAAGAAFF